MRRIAFLLVAAVLPSTLTAPLAVADSAPIGATTGPVTTGFQPYDMVTRAADSIVSIREALTADPSERRIYKLLTRIEHLDGTQRLTVSNSTTTLTFQSTLLFAKDSAVLSQEARKELRRAAAKIAEARPETVLVTGYTDNLGSAAHGLTLSRQRAAAVKRVMEKETPGVKYTAKGFGERDPIADNATEEGRVKNRRVALGWEGLW